MNSSDGASLRAELWVFLISAALPFVFACGAGDRPPRTPLADLPLWQVVEDLRIGALDDEHYAFMRASLRRESVFGHPRPEQLRTQRGFAGIRCSFSTAAWSMIAASRHGC